MMMKKKAFVMFTDVLNKCQSNLLAKEIQVAEKEKWGKLAELLAMELEAAALRTESISSIPAF